METISISREREAIHWKQLWSLAALYGSVVIGWIAYENYQPKLLDKFQFTQFAFLLTICQAIILALTPPIAGLIGDRFRFEKGHRLPIITAGISFAAMIFMAVAFTLLSNPGEFFKWVLPVLIICWLVAMSIFTSPALSTLELFTPVEKLPRAMAVLTIVGNLVYAIEPVIVDIIDYLGAPLTFIAGGAAVFVSGYYLQKHSLALFRTNDYREAAPSTDDVKKSRRVMIFFLGIALGIPTVFLFKFMPAMLTQQLEFIAPGTDGKLLLMYLLLISAVVSLPASALVSKVGISRSFATSLLLTALCAALMVVFHLPSIAIAASLCFAVSFSMLSVSALPLALSLASDREKVFCVGIFFSGAAIPEGIFEAIQAMP